VSISIKGCALVQEYGTEQRLQEKENVVDSEDSVNNGGEGVVPNFREITGWLFTGLCPGGDIEIQIWPYRLRRIRICFLCCFMPVIFVSNVLS
jgi:hypothetical protein